MRTKIMRKFSMLSVCAAVAFAAASPAWAQNAPRAPNPNQELPGDGMQTERKVTIVDVASLPSDAQRKVNAATLQMSEKDMQIMRAAVAAMPEAASALMEKGLQPAQVIAVDESDDGAVVLITRTAI